jgi:hypothetical protein
LRGITAICSFSQIGKSAAFKYWNEEKMGYKGIFVKNSVISEKGNG